MNQAFHLYRLQQIDTQIDQIMVSLNEIEKLLSGDESVKSAIQILEELSKQLKNDQSKLKNIEFAVKEQQIKIAQTESTLYSGKVRNPKELQDLQKDITSLKKHLAALEDQQLEAMMTAEGKEAEVTEAQLHLNRVQATFAEKSSGWAGQKTEFLRLLDRLKAERTTATPPIQTDSMSTYDNIRKRKSGIAVTSARDGSCIVCGASIRPMELQAARTAHDLVFCTNCGRILYVG